MINKHGQEVYPNLHNLTTSSHEQRAKINIIFDEQVMLLVFYKYSIPFGKNAVLGINNKTMSMRYMATYENVMQKLCSCIISIKDQIKKEYGLILISQHIH